MAPSLLSLPLEIRLEIYTLAFGEGTVILDAGNYAGKSYLIPEHTVPVNAVSRSSQLLQTCKTILYEARPILYRRTTVHVASSTFAGALPVGLTNGSPLAPHVRNLIWQIQCDIAKKFYFDEFVFTQSDMENLENLEIRCRAENWRDSYCGDVCDRKAFLEGQEQMIKYGKALAKLAEGAGCRTTLVEDRKYLGKGEVRVRLGRSNRSQGPEDILVN